AGRRSDAIAEARGALDRAPLPERAGSVRGMPLYPARQYDQAQEVLQNVIEMDANRPFEHGWLGDAYVQKAKYDEAIAEFQKALSLGGQALERGEVLSESMYHSMHLARL